MHLPEDFIRHTREIMGDELFDTLTDALAQEPPVSIRMNPWKWNGDRKDIALYQDDVPWCPNGLYLRERPNFTFDPLLHAGVYYVQEASSMFVDRVLRQYVKEPVRMLDLCAAPGGKTTCAASALPEGSILYSNEPIRNRAQILSENTQKWMSSPRSCTSGQPATTTIITTNCYPKDYKKAKATFDVILCDVPCSGEGMFRKDEGAIGEWSQRNVEKCQALQREIVETIWPCLRPGGLLIYSTCTFNTHENEENVRWILDNLDATILPIETEDAWGITGSLLEGFHQPVYRFIPGRTIGEGLFMAAMRKGQEEGSKEPSAKRLSTYGAQEGAGSKRIDKWSKKSSHNYELCTMNSKLSTPALTILEPTFLNDLHEASTAPRAELTYDQAIGYLRREAITLPPDTPRGIVVLTYRDAPLGLAKNIGNRANNLYPKEWRIKTTHIPTIKYSAIP